MKISNTMKIKQQDGSFEDVKISYIEPNYCTAEGKNTTASGDFSHAEGYYAIASGETSHAEGYETTASGGNSHAEGWGTEASGFGSHAEGSETVASGSYSHAEGRETTASGVYSHAEGEGTIESISIQRPGGGWNGYSIEDESMLGYLVNIGSVLECNGKYAIVKNYEIGSYPPLDIEPEDFLPESDAAFTTVNIVNGIALGYTSHVEGKNTTASGDYSHAEGESTIASGHASHAEGKGTVASFDCQHVQGKYNIEDTNNTYAFIIGNGKYNNHSNALAVKWNGDVVIKNNALPLSPVYSGYVTAESIGNITANSYKDVAIDFPAEFFYDGNQPIVIPSLVHTNPVSTPYLSVTVPDREIVNEIGTATIRIFNTYSGSVNPGLQYTVTPCLNFK